MNGYDLTGSPQLEVLELVGADRFAELSVATDARLRALSVTAEPISQVVVPHQTHLRGKVTRGDFDRLDLSEVGSLVLHPIGWHWDDWRDLELSGPVLLDLQMSPDSIAQRDTWRFLRSRQSSETMVAVLRGANLDLVDAFAWVSKTLPDCRYVDCRSASTSKLIDGIDTELLNDRTIHLHGLTIEPPQVDAMFDWLRADGQIWATTRFFLDDCRVSREAWERLVMRHRADGNDGEADSGGFTGTADVYLRTTPLSVEDAEGINWPESITLHQEATGGEEPDSYHLGWGWKVRSPTAIDSDSVESN